MTKEPEFKDKWILLWFAAVFLLFLPLGLGSTPGTHGAYWRETLGLALMLSFVFTVLAGLVRPGGWVAALGMLRSVAGSRKFMPRTCRSISGSPATYFTLFFSLGNRLTLGKTLLMAAFSGLFMSVAYLVDPSVGPSDFFQGVLGWGSLSVILVAANALVRLALSPFHSKASRAPDLQEDYSSEPSDSGLNSTRS